MELVSALAKTFLPTRTPFISHEMRFLVSNRDALHARCLVLRSRLNNVY